MQTAPPSATLQAKPAPSRPRAQAPASTPPANQPLPAQQGADPWAQAHQGWKQQWLHETTRSRTKLCWSTNRKPCRAQKGVTSMYCRPAQRYIDLREFLYDLFFLHTRTPKEECHVTCAHMRMVELEALLKCIPDITAHRLKVQRSKSESSWETLS